MAIDEGERLFVAYSYPSGVLSYRMGGLEITQRGIQNKGRKTPPPPKKGQSVNNNNDNNKNNEGYSSPFPHSATPQLQPRLRIQRSARSRAQADSYP
jgi:hypothetical protein